MAGVLKSLSWTLLLTVVLLGIPKSAGNIASVFDYGAIDPDGSFAWLCVHHLVQGAIFWAIMLGIRKISPLGFQVKLG